MVINRCTDKASISELFAEKCHTSYTRVPCDSTAKQYWPIRDEIETKLTVSGYLGNELIINHQEVADAISKLKAHNSDGNLGISTCYSEHRCGFTSVN
jgi:hypothetical protein